MRERLITVFNKRERCPHCQQTPCMGGKGPGSCMSGRSGKNKSVDVPAAQEDSDYIELHNADWELEKANVGKIAGSVISRWRCSTCGATTVAAQGTEPPRDVHPKMKRGKR